MAASIDQTQMNPFAAKMAAREAWKQSFERDLEKVVKTISETCLGIAADAIQEMLSKPWRPNCVKKVIPCDFIRASREFRKLFGKQDEPQAGSFEEPTFELITADLSNIPLKEVDVEVDVEYYQSFVLRVTELAVQKIRELSRGLPPCKIDGQPTGWRYDIRANDMWMQSEVPGICVSTIYLEATLVKMKAAVQKPELLFI